MRRCLQCFSFCCSSTDSLVDVAPWASLLGLSLIGLRPRWPFSDPHLKIYRVHDAVLLRTLRASCPCTVGDPPRFTPRQSCLSVVLLRFHLKIAPALHDLSFLRGSVEYELWILSRTLPHGLAPLAPVGPQASLLFLPPHSVFLLQVSLILRITESRHQSCLDCASYVSFSFSIFNSYGSR